MRELFKKIHLWLSLPLGLIISVICLSGAVLVFEKEITRAVQRESDTVTTQSGEMRQRPKSLPFFQTVRKVHRWLLDPPATKGEKSVGKVIVGVTTMAMVVVLVSGLVIWIPRSRKALKSRLSVSVTKGWKRFLYDSHVSIGFYCTILLLLMALTGLTWSFSWYRTAAYSLFGENPTASVHRTDKGKENPRKEEIKITWKDAQASAPQSMKGWFYAFHTGSWGGMPTKVLYFLAALSGGILPLSGYYLWWKRKHYK